MDHILIRYPEGGARRATEADLRAAGWVPAHECLSGPVIEAEVERLTKERDEARTTAALAAGALAGCVRHQWMRTHADEEPYNAAWAEAKRLVGAS